MLQNLNNSSSFLRLVLIGAGVVVIIAGLKTFADIISPAIMAGFFALLFIPLYQWLQRKGLRSGLALLVLILLLLGIALGLGLLIATSFNVLFETLPEYTANLETEVANLANTLSQIGVEADGVERTGDTAVSLMTSIVGNIMETAVNMLLVGMVVLVLLIFIIAESPHYPARLKRGLGTKNDLMPQIRELRTSLINYFVARIKVNGITGTAVFIMLFAAGVDFAALWGVLAVFLSFIPYFGLVIAMIPAVILAFAEGGITLAVVISLGYLIINQVIEQVVAPKIIADDISLSPAVTFFALFFWGWAFGFLGVILAAPLTVLLLMILQSYPDTRWLAIMAIADENSKSKPEQSLETK